MLTPITQAIIDSLDMQNIKAFIFDCDGTLVDSTPVHDALWQDVLAEHDLEHAFDDLSLLGGMPDRDIVSLLNERYEREMCADTIANNKEQQALQRIEQITANLDIIAIAKHFNGKLPMAVVSGGERSIVEASLKQTGIFDLFHPIVCADAPVKGKPAPDIFDYAAEQMGVAAQYCHVFEDGDSGIAGAKAAHMTVTDVRKYLA